MQDGSNFGMEMGFELLDPNECLNPIQQQAYFGIIQNMGIAEDPMQCQQALHMFLDQCRNGQGGFGMEENGMGFDQMSQMMGGGMENGMPGGMGQGQGFGGG
jgi:hypothetical protein